MVSPEILGQGFTFFLLYGRNGGGWGSGSVWMCSRTWRDLVVIFSFLGSFVHFPGCAALWIVQRRATRDVIPSLYDNGTRVVLSQKTKEKGGRESRSLIMLQDMPDHSRFSRNYSGWCGLQLSRRLVLGRQVGHLDRLSLHPSLQYL
jgi:hypothetical protein